MNASSLSAKRKISFSQKLAMPQPFFCQSTAKEDDTRPAPQLPALPALPSFPACEQTAFATPLPHERDYVPIRRSTREKKVSQGELPAFRPPEISS